MNVTVRESAHLRAGAGADADAGAGAGAESFKDRTEMCRRGGFFTFLFSVPGLLHINFGGETC